MKLLKYRGTLRYDPETVFLQRLLNDEARGTVVAEDGLFGPKTKAAVKAFQSKHHLKRDGIVGPNTWRAFRLTTEVTVPVNLVPQYSAETCWSASASMLHGGNMSAGAGKGKYAKDFGVTRPDGSPSYGLATDRHDPTLAKQFADSHGFTLLSHQSWTRGGLTQLLSTKGPLMVLGRTRKNNPHAWVVSGLWDRGQGGATTTAVRIHDPWPPGKGKIYPVFWGDDHAWITQKWFYLLHR